MMGEILFEINPIPPKRLLYFYYQSLDRYSNIFPPLKIKIIIDECGGLTLISLQHKNDMPTNSAKSIKSLSTVYEQSYNYISTVLCSKKPKSQRPAGDRF